MTFKKFAIGLAIFILTVLFMIFVQRTFLPTPKINCQPNSHYTPYYDYDSDIRMPSSSNSISSDLSYQTCWDKYEQDVKNQKQNSFILILGLSVFVIIMGVLVKSVPTISWGLIPAGLVMILYVLIANFEEVGKPWRAAITGIALVALIWIAFRNLGEEADNKPAPTRPTSNDTDKI